MDEKRLVRALQEIEMAERECAPILGPAPLAFDSAPAVYRAALDAMGVDVTGVHPSGWGPVYRAHRRVGRGRQVGNVDLSDFPDIARFM